MMRALLPLVVALGTALVALGLACSPFDPNATTTVSAPDFGQFSGSSESTEGGPALVGVDALLEKRCGTLDCHGQYGRGMRIFGVNGSRLIGQDAANIPGDQPTTDAELVANYQAVIGLQPELMSEVVQGKVSPTSLLLLRKPLQLERHKGGPVFVQDDAAYNCIVSWLGGQTSDSQCAASIGEGP
jgi:hypothetical protein